MAGSSSARLAHPTASAAAAALFLVLPLLLLLLFVLLLPPLPPAHAKEAASTSQMPASSASEGHSFGGWKDGPEHKVSMYKTLHERVAALKALPYHDYARDLSAAPHSQLPSVMGAHRMVPKSLKQAALTVASMRKPPPPDPRQLQRSDDNSNPNLQTDLRDGITTITRARAPHLGVGHIDDFLSNGFPLPEEIQPRPAEESRRHFPLTGSGYEGDEPHAFAHLPFHDRLNKVGQQDEQAHTRRERRDLADTCADLSAALQHTIPQYCTLAPDGMGCTIRDDIGSVNFQTTTEQQAQQVDEYLRLCFTELIVASDNAVVFILQVDPRIEAATNFTRLTFTGDVFGEAINDVLSRAPHLTFLNITNNLWAFSLEDSPDIATFLPQLQTLAIDLTIFTHTVEPLSMFVGQSTTIEVLSITRCLIAEQINPISFETLPNLLSLDLSGNLLGFLSSTALAENTRLRVIHLNDNMLSRLAINTFQNQRDLRALNLDFNLFSAVPAIASTVINAISLQGNLFDQFPAELFNHPSLVFVDLSGNQLHALPLALCNSLPKLRNLYLTRNMFTALDPRPLALCHELTDLFFLHNAITAIPEDTFAPLLRLRRLDFSGNVVTALPPGIFATLSDLQFLRFAGNRIDQLPPQLFQAQANVTLLSLWNNPISDLPTGIFDNMSRLRGLFLNSLELAALPSGVFAHLTSLEKVSFRHNEISTLADDLFASCTLLSELRISENMITRLPASLFLNSPRVNWFFFSNNRIGTIPANFFDATPDLQYVDMGFNRIGSIAANAFASLTRLLHLDITANRITTLPAGIFRQNTQIARLYLSRNNLGELPAALFENTLRIYELGMSQCNLQFLPTSLLALPRLQSLDLSINDMLEAPLLQSDVTFLNVSFNERLVFRNPNLYPKLVLLDISKTASPLTPNLCNILGQLSVIIAKEMPQPTAAFLVRCLNVLTFLDMTNNEITDLVALQSVLDTINHLLIVPGAIAADAPVPSVLLPAEDESPAASFTTAFPSDSPLFRPTLTPPAQEVTTAPPDDVIPSLEVITSDPFSATHLQLGNERVRCDLATRVVPVVVRFSSTQTFRVFEYAPALSYQCMCNVGFRQTGPTCEQILQFFDHPQNVVFVVLVSILSGGLLMGAFLYLRSRQKTLKFSLQLSQHLLEDAENEVIALKQAWEIEPADIVLEARLDDDLPGTFGQVWRARWNQFPVAVKMLRGTALMFGSCVATEFQKEIDFLMRARHPNIVRFFGAGVWSSGENFLVVEIVDRGALTTILYDPYTQSKRCLLADHVDSDPLSSVRASKGSSFVSSLMSAFRTSKSLQQDVFAAERTGNAESGIVNRSGSRQGDGVQTHSGDLVALVELDNDDGDAGEEAGDSSDTQRLLASSNKGAPSSSLASLSRSGTMSRARSAPSMAPNGHICKGLGDELKVRFAVDIASGMNYIHDLSQFHRDLKSGNILITSNLRAKVADFGSIREIISGIGRRAEDEDEDNADMTRARGRAFLGNRDSAARLSCGTDESSTMTRNVGTPFYMAPEILFGKTYNQSADVWSFGVLMWELSEQCMPNLFQLHAVEQIGPALPALRKMVGSGLRLPLESLSHPVLKEIAESCLQDDPLERPSFGEMCVKLTEALEKYQDAAA